MENYVLEALKKWGYLPGDVIKEDGDTWDNMTKTQSNSPFELADGNDRNMPEPALLLLTG